MKRLRVVWGVALLALAASTALASSVIGLSVEDQTRLSKLVVAGKVIDQQGVLNPDNGLETAVRLAVTEVFKGDVRPGDTVLFHTRSGELAGERSEAVGEVKLNAGQEVLVFIEEVDGRPYNLALSMGVWNVLQDPAGRTLFKRAVEDGLEIVGDTQVEYGPLSITEMSGRIDRANRQPAFEHPLLREMQRAGR